MKAITIYQPWASLIACGAKHFETRSWATSYRGLIAIHAGAKPVRQCINGVSDQTLRAVRRALGLDSLADLHLLPLGCVVAKAELVGCWGISDGRTVGIDHPIIEQPNQWREIWGDELRFGDYSPGRYAWELKNVKPLPEPISAKGMMRLWEWEDA